MTLTGRQIREARALLGWTSPRLARTACISFAQALAAQDDEGARTLDGLQVRAVRVALERGGIAFGPDGEPRLRSTTP